MTDLARLVRDQGLSFLLVSFTDLFGVQRSKLVPASAVASMAEAGLVLPALPPGSISRRPMAM